MKNKLIEYFDDQTLLEGYLSFDTNWKEKKPTVILCHAWRGKDEFVCEKAQMMTEWGYVGFALDIFGKGVLGKSTEENKALIAPFMNDRKLLQNRLLLALDVVRKQPQVDPSKIAVIGFCFGGLCALDLARSGEDIKGAVSMHGLLLKPEKLPEKQIKAKILALHGHDDPMVTPEEVLHFEQEMTKANVDWQLHVFGRTLHAFTNPIANDPGFGTVYNRLAAERAWKLTRLFFEEIFN